MYYAHSTAEPDRSNWQPLSIHFLAALGRKAQTENAALFAANTLPVVKAIAPLA